LSQNGLKLGIFAVIGVLALVTGFTNNTENEVQTTTPESHVWTFSGIDYASGAKPVKVYVLNKVTGEVRFYSGAKRK
tara:strand:- start:275 stop:505 length:231 start_codon:yes stop_codon:yes gene_type:complete